MARLLYLLAAGCLAVQIVKFPACPGKACVFPVHRAEFLAGARFDVRVEIHDEDFPNDFQVHVAKDGVYQDIQTFFGAKEASLERWSFKYAADVSLQMKLRAGEHVPHKRVLVASRIWRNVTLGEPGSYAVKVTYDGATEHVVEWRVHAASCQRKARNVIFMIADGTTTNMISAARAMAKKNYGGKFDRLQLDDMDFLGHVMTSSLDSLMTDSSNSASAYFSGHKAIVSSLGVYPDSNDDPLDDPKVELLAELARRRSPARGGRMAIGIVTTADVTDATPAAMFSHDRVTSQSQQTLRHFLYGATNASVPVAADVLLGGGGAKFHSPDNYYAKFRAEFGYRVVHTATELRAYRDTMPLLGIFHKGDLDVYVDRKLHPENMANNHASPLNDGRDATDQPSLVEMTIAALDLLKRRSGDAGFFAMVEAASPDKMMHRMDYHRSLVDVIEFDQAVKAAVAWVADNDPDTLIVATADHGHGFDVYGTVDTQLFAADPPSAIGVYMFAGWPDYEDLDDDGFPDSLNVRTVFAGNTNNHPAVVETFQMNRTHPRQDYSVPYTLNIPADKFYRANPAAKGLAFNGNLPRSVAQAAHTLTDVPLFASGPGAERFARVMDNTQVFFHLANILALGEPSPEQCAP